VKRGLEWAESWSGAGSLFAQSGAARSVIGHGVRQPPASPTHFEACCAFFAEVEVDTETGDMSVLDMVAAHDIRKAINPVTLDSKIQGGIMEAIGYSAS
jgi:xanthine dehydrogenase molybdenum-binding subunit